MPRRRITRTEACRIIVCDKVNEVRDQLMEKYHKILEKTIPDDLFITMFNACRNLYLKGQCGKAHHRPALAAGIFYYLIRVLAGNGIRAPMTQHDICHFLGISEGGLRLYSKYLERKLKGGLPIGTSDRQDKAVHG